MRVGVPGQDRPTLAGGPHGPPKLQVSVPPRSRGCKRKSRKHHERRAAAAPVFGTPIPYPSLDNASLTKRRVFVTRRRVGPEERPSGYRCPRHRWTHLWITPGRPAQVVDPPRLGLTCTKDRQPMAALTRSAQSAPRHAPELNRGCVTTATKTFFPSAVGGFFLPGCRRRTTSSVYPSELPWAVAAWCGCRPVRGKGSGKT